jgi:DNA-directed RNA polymerase subunit RPC12/RpoP
MPNQFASGKYSIAECDRCGQQFKLKQLKEEIIKTKRYNLLVCPECWDPDQPQLQLGMYPVYDPQAVRNPRRDTTYVTSGTNVDGFPSGGSRDIQWGWNPVGGSSQYDNGMTPNYLALTVSVGTVTISTSA